MGQYYTLACPETGTHIDPHTTGSFIKAYEQIWSSGQPAALAFMLSAGRGDHPRDLPWAPQGPWAGRMPLMVGDYAGDGDLIGRTARMGQNEETIYGNATDKTRALDARMSKRKTLLDVATSFMPIFERTHGVRSMNLDINGSDVTEGRGMRDFIPAKHTATGWELDLSEVAAENLKEVGEYYERVGIFKQTAWQRGPLTVNPQIHFTPLAEVPDTIPSETEGTGGAMLWVNLDRREFVDPGAMGDIPDLTGVMCGMSARAVLA